MRWKWLTTADGERVRARYTPGAGSTVVVLAHGFTGALDKPAVLDIVGWLAPFASVLSLDLRGHGRSSGLCTLGDAEVLDLDAAVGWARSLGHDQVVALGFSMGASVVLRHAGLTALHTRNALPARNDLDIEHDLRHPVDAVVAVSGPGQWFFRGTPAMRRLHRIVEHRAGRALAARVARTRITDRTWSAPLPLDPIGAAAALTVPLLVVHGDDDHYFPAEHGAAVATAAGAQLWVEAGMGHAEAATTSELVARIGAHLPRLLATGRDGQFRDGQQEVG